MSSGCWLLCCSAQNDSSDDFPTPLSPATISSLSADAMNLSSSRLHALFTTYPCVKFFANRACPKRAPNAFDKTDIDETETATIPEASTATIPEASTATNPEAYSSCQG